MKNYVPFPSSLKSIAYFSFFGVRNLKAVEGIFMFSLPKFDLFLFSLMERRASATKTYHKLIGLFFGSFFDKCKKKLSLLKLLYLPFFRWNI